MGTGVPEKGAKRRPGRAAGASQDSQSEDEQTELEASMRSSGRHDAAPAEGLVGAHTARRRPEGAEPDEDRDDPSGPGSDVAPTATAAQRERERHRLERQGGRVPAGEEGRARAEPGSMSRDQLAEAARQADELVAGHPMPSASTDPKRRP